MQTSKSAEIAFKLGAALLATKSELEMANVMRSNNRFSKALMLIVTVTQQAIFTGKTLEFAAHVANFALSQAIKEEGQVALIPRSDIIA